MRRELFRYVIVGLGSNLVLFIVYLVITSAGVGHKTAMSLLYVFGVLITFLFNRNWTFGHMGGISTAFSRYATAYATGYLINLSALYLLVDRFGLPHQLVQGILIFFVAVVIFLIQKQWVFQHG